MHFFNLTTLLIGLCMVSCVVSIQTHASKRKDRRAKVFSFFEVVTFPNDVCDGSGTRNGTCYSEQECIDKAGTASGSCAEGFGVCCVFTLTCGQRTNDNCTYLLSTDVGTTSTVNECTFTICPCDNNICRIRYDFSSFQIANPVLGETAAQNAAVAAGAGNAIGDCIEDTFSVSTAGGSGSPVICGTNTGYHMILDNTGAACQTANFRIGSSGGVTRMWEIKVQQFACGNEDVSGPPGCLQYYTGAKGNIESFNFPTSTTANVAAKTTHLSNQDYEICIRREAGTCYICYTVQKMAAAANTPGDQNSFGLSEIPPAVVLGVPAMVMAPVAKGDNNCNTDFIEIAGGQLEATAKVLNVPVAGQTRFCGRAFGIDGSAVNQVICSNRMPFRVGVNFDANEGDVAVAAAADDASNEQSVIPGGIVGFRLMFEQMTVCTP